MSQAIPFHQILEAIGITEIQNTCVFIAAAKAEEIADALHSFDNIDNVFLLSPPENASSPRGSSTKTTLIHSMEDLDPDIRFHFAYIETGVIEQVTHDDILSTIFGLLAPEGTLALSGISANGICSFPDSESIAQKLWGHGQFDSPQHVCERLGQVGYTNISFKTYTLDRNTPRSALVAQMPADHALAKTWTGMVEDEQYSFCIPVYLVLARKENSEPTSCYFGPFATDGEDSPSESKSGIMPMTELDLREVMSIEMESFPDPWTPIAYAMELRHNPTARYVVFRDEAGKLQGYIGWWEASNVATLAHIAVSKKARRQGVGKRLVDHMFNCASASGCAQSCLQVRAANATARRFYEQLGYEQVSISTNYYTNPDDDAVIMIVSLHSDY